MSDNHEHDAAYSPSHGSLKSYILGFMLSIILTIIPYVIVVEGLTSKTATVVIIMFFALLQLLVQLVLFLHLDTSSGQRWNLLAFIFTAIIIAIIVIGSLWIMYNLNAMMMPMKMPM